MPNMKYSLYEWCITPSLNNDPEWGLRLLKEYTGYYDKNDTKALRQNNKYNESLGVDLTPLPINKIAYGSGKKALWQCSLCGNKWFAQVVERTSKNINRNRTGCPKCNGLQAGSSYGDTFIYSSLNQLTNTSEFRKKLLIDNNTFEADIYDPSLNLIVEYGSSYYHPNPVYSYSKQFNPEDNTTYLSTEPASDSDSYPEDNLGPLGPMGTMGEKAESMNTQFTAAITHSLFSLALSLKQLEIPESTTSTFTVIKRKEIPTQTPSQAQAHQAQAQELFLVYGSAVEAALFKMSSIPNTIRRLPFSTPICLINVEKSSHYPTITVCNKPRLFKSLPEDNFLQLSYIEGTLIIKNTNTVINEVEPIVLKCLVSNQNLYLMNKKLADLIGYKDISESLKPYNLFTKGSQIPQLFTDAEKEQRKQTASRDLMKKCLAAKAGINFINVYHCTKKQINDALSFINLSSAPFKNIQKLTYSDRECLIIRYTSDKNINTLSTLIMLEADVHNRKSQLEFIISALLSELNLQNYLQSINFNISDALARGLKP